MRGSRAKMTHLRHSSHLPPSLFRKRVILTRLLIRRSVHVGQQPGDEAGDDATRVLVGSCGYGSNLAAGSWYEAGARPDSGRAYRLGHLANTAPSETLTRETILPELANLGFIEGRNLVFDARVGEPDVQMGLM